METDMKVTDLNQIQAVAAAYIEENGSELLSYLTLEETTNVFVMIYATNDQQCGHGMDFIGNLSIIASRQRIAIIFLGHHSFYKIDSALCAYEDIEDDMGTIGICIDAALERWRDQCA